MRYLHHDGLNGAKAEYAWLSSAAQAHVRLLGPIPAGPLKTSELTHQLFDPTWSADGPVVEATALEHFACHCFTSTRARPFDYELELRGCGHEVRVTLGDLSEELIAIASRGPRREMDMPLVVLNACGSSKVDPTTSVSFPKLFMENGNRGFLGPEIAIPDDVAAAFSEEFYRSLLLREQTFGTAVHTARLHLLARYLNPLGLAYVAYGNTDLRISQWKEAQA
ncbi:MAG TPA: CHAT domain-containing protein [Pseudonocardiaceae bacterium]|nr:CHAT domain-containing protein [Pseudonocardiaceae bacterium]